MSALSTAEGLLTKMRDACNKGNSAEADKILSQLKVRIYTAVHMNDWAIRRLQSGKDVSVCGNFIDPHDLNCFW